MPDAQPRYKRVLLKVSGEALLGDQPFGIDTGVLDSTAEDIAEVVKSGVELCLEPGPEVVQLGDRVEDPPPHGHELGGGSAGRQPVVAGVGVAVVRGHGFDGRAVARERRAMPSPQEPTAEVVDRRSGAHDHRPRNASPARTEGARPVRSGALRVVGPGGRARDTSRARCCSPCRVPPPASPAPAAPPHWRLVLTLRILCLPASGSSYVRVAPAPSGVWLAEKKT